MLDTEITNEKMNNNKEKSNSRHDKSSRTNGNAIDVQNHEKDLTMK
jgi:hypothetical protein